MGIVHSIGATHGTGGSFYEFETVGEKRIHPVDVQSELGLLNSKDANAHDDEPWRRRIFTIEEAISFLESNLPKTN